MRGGDGSVAYGAVPGDADLPGKDDAAADGARSGEADLGAEQCVAADRRAVAYLHQIVDLGPGVDASFADAGAVDAGVGLDFYRVFEDGGAGLLNGGFYGLGAVYANKLGLSVFDVSLFMGLPVFGGLALQWPIGRLSDRYDRRTVMLMIVLGTMIASFALSILSYTEAALMFLLVAGTFLGGCLATIYPISVAHAFDYIDRSEMISANSSMLLIWAIGATIGPLAASLLMGQVGPSGLFYYLTAIAALLAAFTRYRMIVRRALPANEQTSFVAVGSPTSAIAGALDPRTDPLPEFYYDDVDPGDR